MYLSSDRRFIFFVWMFVLGSYHYSMAYLISNKLERVEQPIGGHFSGGRLVALLFIGTIEFKFKK